MNYRPKFQVPTRESLGLTTHVNYNKYDPRHDQSTDARKSLADLDYSPLRRLTLPSFYMAVLISMGGFIFGYDTGELTTPSVYLHHANTIFKVRSLASWPCLTSWSASV
jgi:hypothetical protein